MNWLLVGILAALVALVFGVKAIAETLHDLHYDLTAADRERRRAERESRL